MRIWDVKEEIEWSHEKDRKIMPINVHLLKYKMQRVRGEPLQITYNKRYRILDFDKVFDKPIIYMQVGRSSRSLTFSYKTVIDREIKEKSEKNEKI